MFQWLKLKLKLKIIVRSSVGILTAVFIVGCAHVSNPFGDSRSDVIAFSELSEAQQKHYQLSLNYIESNHYDVAQGKLLSLIEEYPTFPDAYNALGVVYERRGRVTIASEAFLNAMALNPEYTTAIENYSRLMCYVAGGDSIVSDSDSIESGQLKSMLYTAASRCYINKNEYAKAMVVVKKAIAGNPSYALNYLYLAQIELYNHDYVAAKKSIDRFNDLNGYTKESAEIGLLINQSLGNSTEIEKYQHVLETQFKTRV